MGWLDGKVALITGAASGIGRAVAERFVAEGARVALMDRSEGALGELADRLGKAALGVAGDVTRLSDNRRAVDETLQQFGKLDCLIGNAGIHDAGTDLLDLSPDQLEATYDQVTGVNLKGYLLAAYAAGGAVREARGTMIFTSSTAGIGIGKGGVIYTASKHAVTGLIRKLAVELSPDVRVNGVAPAGTATGLKVADALGGAGLFEGRDIPIALRPEDHAATYLLLASDQSRPITGIIVPTDGGSSIGLTGNGLTGNGR